MSDLPTILDDEQVHQLITKGKNARTRDPSQASCMLQLAIAQLLWDCREMLRAGKSEPTAKAKPAPAPAPAPAKTRAVSDAKSAASTETKTRGRSVRTKE